MTPDYNVANVGDMTQEYEKLIIEIDSILSMVRTLWIESRDDFEKRRNAKRLDELLDERLRLMKARDAAVKIEIPVRKKKTAL